MSSIDPTDGAAAVQSARESLQQGRIDDAIRTLYDVASRDPQNAEAFELLGVAYAQRGMSNEGIFALTQAVNLNQNSASARINLAVALHRAQRTQEAEHQLQEALRIEPGNAKAQQALGSIQAAGAAPVPMQPMPTQSMPAQPHPTQSFPAQSAYPPPQAPPSYGQPTQQYGQHPYGQQPQAPPPYPPQPGYGQHSYPPQGGANYGAYQPGAYATVPTDPTGWSPANLFRVLSEPLAFFQEQRGQRDIGQPIGFLMSVMGIMMVIVFGIGLATGLGGGQNAAASSAGAGPIILGLVIAVPVVLIFVLIGQFIGAGIYHLGCMLFGGQGGYVGTFRALTYAGSPGFALGLVSACINGIAPSMAIVGGILQLIGLIWSFVILVIAFREIHGLTTGTAFGAAILPTIVGIVIVVFVFMALGAMFLGALRQSGQFPGGNPPGAGAPGGFGNPGGFGGPNNFPGGPSGRPGSFGPGSGFGQ